jgi:hypothetical protein
MRDSQGNNCKVMGTSAEEATHVRQVSPLDTKRAEIYNSPEYRTEFENGINPKREAATTKARRSGHVRPLGGK